jgi:hypothetical protein
MDAFSCGDGPFNDSVGGGGSQPESWTVNDPDSVPANLDPDGDVDPLELWNAYYKVDIDGAADEWSRQGDAPLDNPNVANGLPIDLSLTCDGIDTCSSGTFTVDGRSQNGDLLVVLKDGNKSGESFYYWYYFQNKFGDDLAGTFDTKDIFGGKDLSHMTVYEIASDGGTPPELIPVPAAVWLFGSGLLGLVGVARRRKL